MERMLLARGAKILVEDCARVKEGEVVLVITDPDLMSVAEALATASYRAGADPTVAVITPRERHGAEPPSTVARALLACDVFFTPVSRSITHTQAIKAAVAGGARGLVMTQFTEELMRGGGIEADFRTIAPLCRRIGAVLEGGNRLHLTSRAGTNLEVDISGRRGNAMCGIVGPGEFSPIPTIEANVSPVEGTAKGIIVVDASIPYEGIGLLREPVRVEVENGMIVSISGGVQAKQLREAYERHADPNVFNIAEIGIGLNPKGKMIGFMLEDEAVFGTVHIGTGTSITLGGTVMAKCHYDLILWEPSVDVDGQFVLKDGAVPDPMWPKTP